MDCCKKIRYSAYKTLLLQSLFKDAKVSKLNPVLGTVGLSALYLTKESDITTFFALKGLVCSLKDILMQVTQKKLRRVQKNYPGLIGRWEKNHDLLKSN